MDQLVYQIIISTSALLIAISTVFAIFRKTRKWIINKFVEDIDFSKIDKRSQLYTLKQKILSLESEKNDCADEIKNITKDTNDKIKEIIKSTKRIELMNMIDHNPKNKEVILKLYDEYLAMGGNSYIIHRIEEWKEQL